jgi:hypothetical protein
MQTRSPCSRRSKGEESCRPNSQSPYPAFHRGRRSKIWNRFIGCCIDSVLSPYFRDSRSGQSRFSGTDQNSPPFQRRENKSKRVSPRRGRLKWLTDLSNSVTGHCSCTINIVLKPAKVRASLRGRFIDVCIKNVLYGNGIQSSPAGTLHIPPAFPPLKRRAIIIRPALRDCANISTVICSIPGHYLCNNQ